tara:strand:+ start:525 stop:1142 length:618 start_codon:yes stop_codon:yes gene_type:complete
MYLRFVLSQLKVVVLIIFSGIFAYPFFVYPNRIRNWNNRFTSFRTKWYWFAADTEGTGWEGPDYEHYLNATFGLYELVKKRNELGNWVPDYERFANMNSIQRFILAYRWSVVRNGCWNYIQSQQPRQGVWENENCKISTGGYSCKVWRNKTKHGTQSITWEVDGVKYFRYSFTKKLYKDHYVNFMIGASNNRYLIKLRIFDIKTN